MPTFSALFRRKDVLISLFLSILVLSTLSAYSHPARVISTTLAWSHPEYSQQHQSSPIPGSDATYDIESPFTSEFQVEAEPVFPAHELEPLEVLAELYEDERISLLSGYDQASTEALVRTAPGALDPDFNTYISRLEGFVNTWFKDTPAHAPLTHILTRLVTAHPPPSSDLPFEKTLYSLDKNGGEGVPDEFGYWGKRLDDEGWDIKVGDDIWLDAWFREVTDQRGNDGMGGPGAGLWQEMWDGLGRPVLKSDLLR